MVILTHVEQKYIKPNQKNLSVNLKKQHRYFCNWNFVCDMEINELSNQNDFYYPYEEQYAQEESYKELTMNQKENR